MCWLPHCASSVADKSAISARPVRSESRVRHITEDGYMSSARIGASIAGAILIGLFLTAARPSPNSIPKAAPSKARLSFWHAPGNRRDSHGTTRPTFPDELQP